MIILCGVAAVLTREEACAGGKAQHTSLSASTYKRLSFILLKCYLINVLVTLNISTAGGTFVIVELAGRVGHRWELLPHAGVDVWAAGWTRWAHVIDHPWISRHEQRRDLMKVWQKSCIKLRKTRRNVKEHPPVERQIFSQSETRQEVSGFRLCHDIFLIEHCD